MMSSINTVTVSFEHLTVNKREAMRYLGVKACDDTFDTMYNECLKEVQKASSPKAVYLCADIKISDSTVDFGFMRVNSVGLAKNLDGCSQAYVFCATLGIGMDRQYERLSRISQAKATVFSAVGSAMAESLCDYVNGELGEGIETKPRFSCGYGDFCIKHQEEILNALEAQKRLGVCLTDSCMMVPVKTVTAIIGIRR